MDAKLEPGGEAEVATATTAAGPEELRLLPLAGSDDLARRRYQLDLEQVVAGEPVLSLAHADPSAERQAADPHGGAGPGRDRDAVLRQCGVDVAQKATRSDDRRTVRRVDVDPVHPRH